MSAETLEICMCVTDYNTESLEVESVNPTKLAFRLCFDFTSTRGNNAVTSQIRCLSCVDNIHYVNTCVGIIIVVSILFC